MRIDTRPLPVTARFGPDEAFLLYQRGRHELGAIYLHRKEMSIVVIRDLNTRDDRPETRRDRQKKVPVWLSA